MDLEKEKIFEIFFKTQIVDTINEYVICVYINALDECDEQIIINFVDFFERMISIINLSRIFFALCFFVGIIY